MDENVKNSGIQTVSDNKVMELYSVVISNTRRIYYDKRIYTQFSFT